MNQRLFQIDTNRLIDTKILFWKKATLITVTKLNQICIYFQF
jgi:hypothetical protein